VNRAPGDSASPPAVRLSDVCFTYPDQQSPALDSLSLEIEEGESVALLGPSGAGKSTLCRTLNGLIPHFQRGRFSGGVAIFGADAARARVPELARRVGLVFQDFESQLFSTSVELEVAFAPENFGLPREEIRSRITESLRAVGLSGRERRHPAALSGGEKQRLALAAVLAGAPDLLVLDEATTDLDPVGKASVLAVLRALASRQPASITPPPGGPGKPSTILFATSDAEEASFAGRAILLRAGRLEADGPAAVLLSEPARLEAAGIRPPDLAALFARLGRPERPRDVGEAARALAQAGLRLDRRAQQELLAEEAGARPRGPALVEATGLAYSYPDGTRALAGLDLAVNQGEFVALVGPNGSGKTTLAKHLNRLLEPSGGEVCIAGKPTRARSRLELARRVGYVFQNPDHQIFADSIFEEVAFGPRNFGLSPAEVSARVGEALEAVHLTGREEEDPFSLTKGERQRVAVASMLAARPELMVFDEPTTGLDYRESRSMMELISRLHAAGHTIIIITHTMWVVAEYAERGVLMHGGRILADGPVRSLLARPQLLAEASLIAPPIAQLGTALGLPFRSVGEARRLVRPEVGAGD
jgi:energy-coupling factor transport system ATP-binding protein